MAKKDLASLIGAVVNLETYAPEILGTGYRRVKIMSILDYQDALRYAKISTLHPAVLPQLPAGTPVDYTELSYLKLKLNNGDVTALAIPWIPDDGIKEVDAYRRVRIVLDQVSVEEEDALRRLLTSNDYAIIEMREEK